jgi:hypothetical protein
MQCRTPVLEKASKAVWELILDNGGLGKEITDTVEKVFCRLSGVNMMSAPPAADPRKDDMAVDDGEKSNATDLSSSRKRPFSDMNPKGVGAVTNKRWWCRPARVIGGWQLEAEVAVTLVCAVILVLRPYVSRSYVYRAALLDIEVALVHEW